MLYLESVSDLLFHLSPLPFLGSAIFACVSGVLAIRNAVANARTEKEIDRKRLPFALRAVSHSYAISATAIFLVLVSLILMKHDSENFFLLILLLLASLIPFSFFGIAVWPLEYISNKARSATGWKRRLILLSSLILKIAFSLLLAMLILTLVFDGDATIIVFLLLSVALVSMGLLNTMVMAFVHHLGPPSPMPNLGKYRRTLMLCRLTALILFVISSVLFVIAVRTVPPPIVMPPGF